MDTLKNIVSDIRIFLYGGVLTLPLTIAGTLAVLGLFTANYAILFFLIGYLILVPLATLPLNWIGSNFDIFKTKTTDVCKLVIPFSSRNTPVGSVEENVMSSSWVAMIAFFLGYLFTNSLQLYKRKTEDTTITVKTESTSDLTTKASNRTSQAILAMISIIVFGLIVLGFRLYTGCETKMGLILTSIIFSLTGVGWYQALSSVGQDRLSDIFGIANRLLPPSAISNAPIACIPIQV
jgi:uncharacterized membrane protein